jgi:hypothetical protein
MRESRIKSQLKKQEQERTSKAFEDSISLKHKMKREQQKIAESISKKVATATNLIKSVMIKKDNKRSRQVTEEKNKLKEIENKKIDEAYQQKE